MATTGTSILGDPTVSGVLNDERRRYYLRENTFAELYPNVAPFYTFASKLNRITNPDDIDYKLFEHRRKAIDDYYAEVEVSGTPPSVPAVASDVTVDIDDASGWPAWLIAGQVVEVISDSGSTKAVMRVKSVNSSAGTATLTTIWRNGTPSFADGDKLQIIGYAGGEGAGIPEAWSDELSVLWNSVQEFRTPIKISEWKARSRLRGAANEVQRLLLDNAVEQKINIARTFYFGFRRNGLSAPSGTQITDANGNYVTTTQGIVSAIKHLGLTGAQYHTMSESGADWNDFVDIMKQVWLYSNAQGIKYGFMGYDWQAYLSKTGDEGLFGNTGVNFQQLPTVVTRYGFNVKELVVPWGRLRFVHDPLLRGDYAKLMVIVDPAHIGVVQFEKPQIRMNVQQPDVRQRWHEYVAMEGLWFDLIESHAVLELT